jgi:hypothetical protein
MKDLGITYKAMAYYMMVGVDEGISAAYSAYFSVAPEAGNQERSLVIGGLVTSERLPRASESEKGNSRLHGLSTNPVPNSVRVKLCLNFK